MPPFDKEVFRMNYRPLQIFAVCCTPFRCTGRRPGDGVRPGTLSEQRAAIRACWQHWHTMGEKENTGPGFQRLMYAFYPARFAALALIGFLPPL